LKHHITANLTRKLCAKFYQDGCRFVKDMTKKFGVFLFTVSTAVHLQNTDVKFHKVM